MPFVAPGEVGRSTVVAGDTVTAMSVQEGRRVAAFFAMVGKRG